MRLSRRVLGLIVVVCLLLHAYSFYFLTWYKNGTAYFTAVKDKTRIPHLPVTPEPSLELFNTSNQILSVLGLHSKPFKQYPSANPTTEPFRHNYPAEPLAKPSKQNPTAEPSKESFKQPSKQNPSTQHSREPFDSYYSPDVEQQIPQSPEPSLPSSGFVVNCLGCQIPRLDPFHPSVKSFVKFLPDLKCSGKSFIIVENTTLLLNKTSILNYGKCFIQNISRKNENLNELGTLIEIENGSISVSSEFVKVECKSDHNHTVTYRQFYPFVFRKETVEERIKHYRQKTSNLTSKQFRIIMLGLDSVSKNQFLRHMQKTHVFIKEKLPYIEFHGYNKIGKNTYSNILPMFSGKLEHEVPDLSLESADVLPLIWKEYMNHGYKTLYSEDLPHGSAFNYARKGFNNTPTDYYLRPWSLAVEPHISNWKTGCLNERIEADVILKYMEDFFDLFPSDPLFAFTFLTRMSHDYINQLSYQDKPVRDLLERLYLKGHFNNTIMFLFGDHGFRFGDIRSTYVGRMEGRLPFMFVFIPPWFLTSYPQMYKNLKANERRLTSALDVHATLEDLLHFTGEGFEAEGVGRSISLLKHPIPVNRTCVDAAIPVQFCACVRSEPVSLGDKTVRESALAIVRKINSITQKNRAKCSELSLTSILNANKQEVGLGEDSSHDGFSNFLITLKVFPSDGIFEGSVWYNGKSSYTADNTIERINLYKNQSACVDENFLKPYCYCVD